MTLKEISSRFSRTVSQTRAIIELTISVIPYSSTSPHFNIIQSLGTV